MTDETLDMMRERERQQTVPSNGTEYRTLNTEIRNKCRQTKVKLLNKKCAEIERMSIMDKADMHNRIKEITSTKDMLIDRMHKIKRGNAHSRKGKNTSKMERIRWRTLPRRKRETNELQM